MRRVRFFVGLHQPSDARHFERSFISVNRLLGARGRKSAFTVGDWIMDSGAFSAIAKHGGYPEPVEVYAAGIRMWAGRGGLVAAVAQDYMCEPYMLAKTGLTIADHQRLTIERYDALAACDVGGVYIMPVLQGYAPADYASHVRQYGARLAFGAYVGVGSVCARPAAILAVLSAIHAERPDLRPHGFGVKTTSLRVQAIRDALWSADSMAWSFSARKQCRRANDWREAKRFERAVAPSLAQTSLPV